nr:uncharacterized protein LOC109761376 [Aegilops tauschii subsp. strangulata]
MGDTSSPPPSPSADTPGAPVVTAPPPPAILPAAPVAAPTPAPLAVSPHPSSVLQTIDIRLHVPVTLDLLAGNHAQWRRHFDMAIGMFGLRDHVDAEAVPRLDDPKWLMADHAVVHWLNTTVSPDLLDAVMQHEDMALTVWAAIDGIFRDNQLARAVYIDAEYHALVQGGMTIMLYRTKLKMYADQLRDLGQPMGETPQVFHLLRGLGRQNHGAIPHITSRSPLPSFLHTRSFLLLEEHQADQTARIHSAHALVAGRGVATPSPPLAAAPDVNEGRGRGRGNGNGQGSSSLPQQLPPRAPGLPASAPGTNSWTDLV